MYGIGEYDDEQLRQLLGFKLPEEGFQAQEVPQLQTGLLGSSGQNTPQLPHGGSEAAANLAQIAQAKNQSAGNDNLAQMQAANSQASQQALVKQQQQQQQTMQTIMMLAKLFMGGA